MSNKLNDSLTTQRHQLLTLLNQREQLEANLKNISDSISQLRGSIQALEYIQTLNLIEPSTDESKKDSPSPVVP